MKKIFILLILFCVYTAVIVFCPKVTFIDKNFIVYLQEHLKNISIFIPLLPDCKLYSLMIVLPILIVGIFACKKKNYIDTTIIALLPLLVYLFNCILKTIVQRPRPPVDLQLVIHPSSYTYVSSHSLVTFCLWGLIVYYSMQYLENKFLKYSILVLAILWTLFVGISRIWLGVHHPTDVIGSYFLGIIILLFVIKIRYKLRRFYNEKCVSSNGC